ncbi:hypothetical protein CFC21_072615 [Triticum aestivum]|uniref:F-box domain-containing protein n=2 Tax=Triticum aestivum TaxID=4565 RepID=A0A3B6LQF6_WHEAT|nr:hypothetical protein CFC21_072615 [Triticum aestivum]
MEAPLSVYDQPLRLRRERRRPLVARGEDRLGALPDDVLHLVLRRLDTRSALATSALSRRWACLPRELPTLEFKVRDILSQRYNQYLQRRTDAANSRVKPCSIKKLDVVLSRYERRGMRSLADSLGGFLHADDANPRRGVHSVKLEIFPTHNSGNLNRLVATAVCGWGVEDLEVVVLNPDARHSAGYSFPHHCFADSSFPNGGVKLKTLKLSNCAPLAARPDANTATARAFSALTVLVLQDMPRTTRGRVYEAVIRACPALEVLHLRSCGCRRRSFSVDAPDSRITELLIEFTGRAYGKIELRALPRLERLACMGAPLDLKFGCVPQLAGLNLSYDEDANSKTPQFVLFGVRTTCLLSSFLTNLTGLEDLVLGFTGPEMWIVRPLDDMPQLGKLKRLLVADMPSSWDITWIRYVLEAAPSLETLHIHVADDDDVGSGGTVGNKLIHWPSSSLEFKHQCLREVVVGGFQGTRRQVQFVRFLRRACTALREVVLLRHGHVVEKGLWDWETLAPKQECQWNEERHATMSEIEDGTDDIACCASRIVFG